MVGAYGVDMNKHQAQLICKQLNVGTVCTAPQKVLGGLLHRMWKIETEHGSFACKELSRNINLNPQTRHIYELTEQIARQFKQLGIPAITALAIHDKHLIDINDSTFLVYPWSQATTLAINTISAAHAIKIAALLAKMHLIDLQAPELADPELHIYQPQTLIYLIERAVTLKLPFAQELKTHQDAILRVAQTCEKYLPSQQTINVVVSHGDLDQKNVLWDNQNNPIIIDWEATHKLNPTQEIVDAALNWSGITASNFDKNLFINMICEYTKAGGSIEQSNLYFAFLAILNNWLHWMVHNIENSIRSDQNKLDEQAQYAQQILLVLNTISLLEPMISELSSSIVSALRNHQQ